MISKAALAALKADNPCDKIASKWVRLRKLGAGYVGPCPLHSSAPQARDSTSFECDADGWVCARCQNGGDVIRLVMLREKVDFRGAVELLGGAIEPDPARAAELELDHARRQAEAEQQQRFVRERQQQAVNDIWRRASDFYGSSAQIYLQEKRGLFELPPNLQLRCIERMPYYDNGSPDFTEIHVGPCMIGPIVDAAEELRGVHLTYLDLDQPDGKAVILAPESEEPLPAKKVRGAKAGNVIRLAQAERPIQQLIIGEGIETVLSVWLALKRAGRDLSRTSFWSAIDLGNLAGKAVGSVAHPTLKDAGGRPRHIPGPHPNLDIAGIIVPPGVNDVVLLGDGDSDRFTVGARQRAILCCGIAQIGIGVINANLYRRKSTHCRASAHCSRWLGSPWHRLQRHVAHRACSRDR
jgi:CHC2 zinc finger